MTDLSTFENLPERNGCAQYLHRISLEYNGCLTSYTYIQDGRRQLFIYREVFHRKTHERFQDRTQRLQPGRHCHE